ncbi:NBR1-Ig-like domain-containing protein [Actinomadura sp. 7K534]|uniref:NBR1-Ig-like domain-containing protein n=1 Tax=Actinomadura sp. 7K534 TaxID=2530366 RepID=UPI001FB7AB70|nr:NBR1-Ig-like domain-containing protein [Actinomadura sp. 7K534]
MRAQAEAIEGFAAVLRELRESVGSPPFREMSGRSGAISHTTLHEATKGNRLPSWGTTVEFVKACGADPEEFRERWEAANQAVRSVSARKGEVARPAGEVAAASAVEPRPVDVDIKPSATLVPVPPEQVADDGRLGAAASRGRFRVGRLGALAAVVVGAGAVIVVAVVVNRDAGAGEDGLKPVDSRSKTALSPADCPVKATNPPPAPPTHKGDAAAFIADITLPDCTHVGGGKTVTKVWRLKNAGKVPWEGYSLRRLDVPQQADQCQTISDVPIDDTPPGKMVDIRTQITTPKKPGLCYVRFKMVDAAGQVAFPGNRPVNFQVIVDGP